MQTPSHSANILSMRASGTVVITGYTGVVGARLYQHLASKGIPLVLINSKGVFVGKLGRVPELVTDDIFNREALIQVSKNAQAFIHLAAAHSGAVSDGVVGALLRNAVLTDYFAGVSAEADAASFIYASSGAIYYQFANPSLKEIDEGTAINVDQEMVYGTTEYLKQVANNRDHTKAYVDATTAFEPESKISQISPRAGYAFGKYIGELSVAKYIPDGRYCILRLGNVYGPGDHDDRIVPKFIRIAQTGETTTVFDWSRNFIWIDDLIQIIERTIEYPEPKHGLLNAVTPGNTIHLLDLANLINQMTGGPGGRFAFNKDVHEPHFEITTKYPEMLPTPPVSVSEGLSKLIECT